MGPDRPNFKSYCVLDPKLAVGTRPEPFRATFRPPKKSATGKNTNFALDGYNRFMKPSWVRAHGLIFGKVYIVWVCAPAYRPLSSSRNHIRENGLILSTRFPDVGQSRLFGSDLLDILLFF